MMSIEQEIYRSYLEAEPFFALGCSDYRRRNPGHLLSFFKDYPAEQNLVITGSKGKGSLARLIARLLSACAVTGLFISPHIESFCERISVDGSNISPEQLECLGREVLRDLQPIERSMKQGEYISPIGILALIAMRYFSVCHTAFQVLECGKGARFDDVNQIRHKIAVIGTIFLEHTNELGGTIGEIAENKASVITENTDTCYIMEQDPVAYSVIKDRAGRYGVELKEYGKDFFAKHITQELSGTTKFDICVGPHVFRGISLPLLGKFQAKHAALAAACYLDIAQEQGWKRPEADFFHQAWSTLSISGRMEILQRNPFVLMDSTINQKSAIELLAVLNDMGIEKAVFLLCIPDGKDIVGVAKTIWPKAVDIVLSRIEHPHYPMEQDQQRELQKEGIPCEFENDFKTAFQIVLSYSQPIIVLVANTFVKYAKKQIAGLIDIT